MKQVVLLISLLLILVLTAGFVGGCKPSNKDGFGISGENSTDVEVDVNDIFGSSDTSGSNESESQSETSDEPVSSSASDSSSASSSGDTSSSNSQSGSSNDSSFDYEDPDVWTKPVKIPAKNS